MKIYADNAATTKMSENAIHTMVSLLEDSWGNPSSLYAHGQLAKEVLEKARADVAAVIGASPDEILFTSGGSEADNQALRSAAEVGAAVRSAAVLSAVTALTHAAPAHAVHPGALAGVGRDVGERDLLLPVADDQGAGLALLHSRGAQ